MAKPKTRNRVKDLRKVRAGDLIPHPENWRIHGAEQKAGLRAALERIGYAGAVIAREDDQGRLHIVDGHMRAEHDPDAVIPVLVTDLTETESREALATYDALGAMAMVDTGRLDALLEEVSGRDEAFDTLLEDVRERMGIETELPPQETGAAHTPSDNDEREIRWDPQDKDSVKQFAVYVPKAGYEAFMAQVRGAAERAGIDLNRWCLRAFETAAKE